jgi:hypothetical protein
VPDFVEIVLVQLSNETRKVAVFKMFREYVFRKLLVLHPWLMANDTARRADKNVPPGRQSCRRRFPIELRFRRSGSPAFCRRS